MNNSQKQILAFRETCVSKINEICNNNASPLKAMNMSWDIANAVSNVLEIDRQNLACADILYMITRLQEAVKFRAEFLSEIKKSLNKTKQAEVAFRLQESECRIAIYAWQIAFYEPTIQQFNEYINKTEA